MKLNIPAPGTVLRLTANQNLPIPVEKRNMKFLRDGKHIARTGHPLANIINVLFSKGETLTVQSVQAGKIHKHRGDRIVFSCKYGCFWLPIEAGFDFDIAPLHPHKKFFLQNRYQDSDWDTMDPEYDRDDFEAACAIAAKMCLNSIVNGMVRVVQRYEDETKQHVCVTFPAGGYLRCS